MTSSDKDFRFMATNDLMVELQKDSIKLDDDSERKVIIYFFYPVKAFKCLSYIFYICNIYIYILQVVKMLLKLLEDKNGEVQNLAVKW